MKVVGISGSPIKNGNVDLLIQQVLKGAISKGAKTEILYLDKLDISPCKSCGKNPEPKFCFIKDDMEKVYAKLKGSDVLVLGSPIYFDTVSAQMKLFLDRCNCLTPIVKKNNKYFFKSRLKKKRKGIIILVAGEKQRFDYALITLQGFLKWSNVKYVDKILYAHSFFEKGKVKEDRKVMQKAFDLGRKLWSAKL
ncbi:MAG: flavodoxin family protein [candidate division Zixibacteria bacterium]|nr:flavodoxin family protein [candidate division Zixibacteria bacterium]